LRELKTCLPSQIAVELELFDAPLVWKTWSMSGSRQFAITPSVLPVSNAVRLIVVHDSSMTLDRARRIILTAHKLKQLPPESYSVPDGPGAEAVAAVFAGLPRMSALAAELLHVLLVIPDRCDAFVYLTDSDECCPARATLKLSLDRCVCACGVTGQALGCAASADPVLCNACCPLVLCAMRVMRAVPAVHCVL
jgi:hypothetical protein